MEWLNSETIEKAGAIVVALMAIGLCTIIFKGYSKTMNNHLHDVHNDNIKKNETDIKLATALTRLGDEIHNLKK